MRCMGSVTSCAKVTLCLLNLWVLCVILVVVLGHWRLFDGQLSLHKFNDDSHMVVMRELKQQPHLLGGVMTNRSKAAQEAPVKTEARLSAVDREMQERVTALRQWCGRLHPHPPDLAALPAPRLSMMLVDRKHKLLFCQIPGVAQNDWRRIFLHLTGRVNVTSHLKITASDAHGKYAKLLKPLSDFPAGERQAIVDESLKVVFVREPLERLLATFQNKFQARYSRYFHQAFGTKIVRRYRKNATVQALKSGSDVRFSEFVQFVLDLEQESEGALNEHWERYYRHCHPCLLRYDVVGKFESLVADTRHALTRARVLQRLQPPYVADTFRNSQAAVKAALQTLSTRQLRRLWKMYYPDYNLFSYPYPDLLRSLLRKPFHDY